MPIAQEVSQDTTTQLQTDLNNATDLMLPNSWLIEKEVLIDALGLATNSLDGFSGIRIYPGAKMETGVDSATKTITLITVAVDDKGNDIVGSVASNISDGAKRYDFAKPCPINCSINTTDLSTNATVLKLSK